VKRKNKKTTKNEKNQRKIHLISERANLILSQKER